MDIPSVRFQPVPEQAQAAITSTQGHPRLIWPVRPKFNIIYNCIKASKQMLLPLEKQLAFINKNNNISAESTRAVGVAY